MEEQQRSHGRRPAGRKLIPVETAASGMEAGAEPGGRLPEVRLDDLRFIRQTMASAGSFTPGSRGGEKLVGASALVAAAVSKHLFAVNAEPGSGWMEVWLVEAAVAVAIAALSSA